MPPFEVEQKYRVRRPAAIRKKLKTAGAKCLHKGWEKNELWDYQGMVRRQASILRLREIRRGGFLTFKGPKLKSRYKKRMEVETAVHPMAARTILLQMGFQVIARYQKTREEYLLNGAHVTLDHLPKLGWFVEIEASPKKIEFLSRRLGFTNKDREERTYLEMVYGPRSPWRGK